MTKQEIKKILNEHGLGAKKKWGQNFLIDTNTQEKIVKSANITSDDFVIEIGPGLGALTNHIIRRTNQVDLYEIDPGLASLLENKYQDKVKHVYCQDILDSTLKYPLGIIVISNLPYYITTPVLFFLLENPQPIKHIIVMMQKEVAERLDAKPRTKQYNALTLILQHLADVQLLFHVPKTSFYPVPEVDSAVISIKPKPGIAADPNTPKFIHFLKTGFNQRRKTLINNLSSGYNLRKSDIENVFDKQFELNVRAEELTLDDFLKLFSQFLEKGYVI